TTGGRSTVLDLRDVDFIDPEGQQLVSEMHSRGVQLLAATPLIQAMIEEISHTSRRGNGVEGKLAGRTDAVVLAHTPGQDPRPL
ncbi:MAG TPA: hypothetical protein VGH38_34665, partial [Bryobacteraceae bacterium]